MTTRLISSRLRSPPRRYTSERVTTPGGTERLVARLLLPNENELNANLEEAVLNLREEYRPENTQKAQDPKVLEYFQFCDVIYGHDPYRYTLCCARVYRFFWYLCFREQRKKGGTKAQRLARQQGQYFNEEEYSEVMRGFEDGPNFLLVRQQPKKPIGKCTFNAYKAVIRKIYKVQIAKKVLAETWDQIWQMCFDELYKHVKERVPLLKKASYAEKVDGEFAPYMIVEHYGAIEDLMWTDSNMTGTRSVVCALRHRYS
jgi:hypothetical protein